MDTKVNMTLEPSVGHLHNFFGFLFAFCYRLKFLSFCTSVTNAADGITCVHVYGIQIWPPLFQENIRIRDHIQFSMSYLSLLSDLRREISLVGEMTPEVRTS